MILLDTDHVSMLMFADERTAQPLKSKLASLKRDDTAISAVTIEESFRGWLASIAREHTVKRQTMPYMRLIELVRFYENWDLVPFDENAADEFMRLRAMRIRIGSQDLKIASIARVHEATLLTANARDYRHIPDLHFENWLNP